MSEENRFEKKKKQVVIVGIIGLLLGASTGVMLWLFINETTKYNDLSGDYDELYIDYLELLYDFNNLENQYFILSGEHIELENAYNALELDLVAMTAERDALLIALENLEDDMEELEVYYLGLIADLEIEMATLEAERDALLNDYQILSDAYDALKAKKDALQIAYNYITETIRQSILPVQYCIFAEAVRRYYKDIYIGGLIGKEYWMAFAEYCRDVILHDSWQENSFIDVSNAFSDILTFGNDTMTLADYIMYWTFWDWLPNWDGYGLTGNELTDIDIIVDWCIDEIDYEWDSDIIHGQEYFDWDYIKFPVETAFRTMGDCEDQAILCAAYLESCGFETAMSIFHDPNHPTIGEFYHGVLLIHIEDTDAFNSMYPDGVLWSIPYDPYTGYTWCWVDTTWDVPFGSIPSWLQDYRDFGIITTDITTLAFCDIDGAIGENLGLTYVMPT